MVTALVARRGQPLEQPFQLDKSTIQRIANPEKEEGPPEPEADALPPRAERLGWRYNVPHLNLVHVRKSGKSTSTDGMQRSNRIPPHANQDLSSTQLAALALFAAQQFKMKIPPEVWIDIAEFTLDHQEKEGPEHKRHDPVLSGGGYAVPTDHARGLRVHPGQPRRQRGCRHRIHDRLRHREPPHGQGGQRPHQAGPQALDGGGPGLTGPHRDLGRHRVARPQLVAVQNTNSRYGYPIYYLYSVEREQDLRGKELVGKHLWYRDGALELLKRIQKTKVRDPARLAGPRAGRRVLDDQLHARSQGRAGHLLRAALPEARHEGHGPRADHPRRRGARRQPVADDRQPPTSHPGRPEGPARRMAPPRPESAMARSLLRLLVVLPPLLALLVLSPAWSGDEDEPLDDSADTEVAFVEQVNRAIEQGVRWLIAKPTQATLGRVDIAHWGLIRGDRFYGGGEGEGYGHPVGADGALASTPSSSAAWTRSTRS